MLIVQISDCHIMEPGELFADRVDSAAGLRSAVRSVAELPIRPDLVLLTGDLVNDGTQAQYDHLVSLLDDLSVPVLPMPGNHDDRSELRRRFGAVLPPGGPDTPIDVVVDLEPIRVIALDTTIPGRHDGRLSDEQLRWLDDQLAAGCDRPTIVAQHHPPVTSGVVWMDESSGFASAAAEGEVIGRHGHVEAVLSGHLHRSFQRRYAGTISVTCPSTAGQLGLGLDGEEATYSNEPIGYLAHHWRPGHGLVSHFVPVGSFESWQPGWAS